MKLIIYQIPPTNNKYIGNSRNYNEYRKAKEKWHGLVLAAILESKAKLKKPLEKAIVRITYFFPDNRRRDLDNYSGKMLLDPLVKEGVIVDDSFQHIKLLLEAYVDKSNPRTEIEIMEDQQCGQL